MKSGWHLYWANWGLLVGTLILFLSASQFLPSDWNRIELPVVQEVDTLPTHTQVITIYVPPPLRLLERKIAASVPSSSDSIPERILLFGDSMMEWLRLRLASWCRSAGYALYSVIWPSSNLIWWGKSDTLRAFIEAYKPTYVLVVLGSNELFVPGIEKRKPYLERILSQIGEIPLVWVGPPAWKPDKGIISFLQKQLGPGRYFSSERLKMDRLEDGAHPTPLSAYEWADSLVAFLRDSALHPLPFPHHPPQTRTALPHRTILLQPHAP
ncbi:MAG: hypothetical protein N3E49_08735 [Bacteroidia bacterium]|nr:hypothetical protein [Bacteroidia bacterium]